MADPIQDHPIQDDRKTGETPGVSRDQPAKPTKVDEQAQEEAGRQRAEEGGYQ